MERNIDLCRKILLEIEKNDTGRPISNLKIENHSLKETKYHCKMLYEEKLITNYRNYLHDNFAVGELTWAGHDFLDKIRDENVWNKVKEIITKNGSEITIDVIKVVATDVITNLIKGVQHIL